MKMFDLYYDIKFVSGLLKDITITDQKIQYPVSSKERVIEQCETALATKKVTKHSIMIGYRIVED